MKIPPRIIISHGVRILCVFALILAPLVFALTTQNAYADITTRTLKLEPNAVGGSTPGVAGNAAFEVNHHFTFTVTVPGTQSYGSVTLQYCDKAGVTASFPTCVEPTGIDTQFATAVTNTAGPVMNTTSVPYTSDTTTSSPTANAVKVNVASGGSLSTTTVFNFTVTKVINPTAINKTFFVWIDTWSGSGGTGTHWDSATVVASTANPLTIRGKMPESLIFCTADQIPLNGGGQPDCPNATTSPRTNLIQFDKFFDPTDTASATSQMAASTNAGSGYVISVTGADPSNGTGGTIASIGHTFAISTRGIAQFGMNLAANNKTTHTPANADDPGGPTNSGIIGANPTPTSGTGNLRAAAFAPYDTNEQWAYFTGDDVAKSTNPTAGPADLQIYTVTYIVNVPGSQAAGTYNTTLTYVCTALF